MPPADQPPHKGRTVASQHVRDRPTAEHQPLDTGATNEPNDM
eukprot:CAMPEP_0174916720 /NCGR_PEP_ID=MMETSP1355-20121228/2001_1 /TAXON_ID=464990 /ORGANISM="Hemiselmis tepida, Strain CCMP443" /LENGTH=41 /DNA_ID= /DNA_START= /DNA_END= /DNA_ORIENTATION=